MPAIHTFLLALKLGCLGPHPCDVLEAAFELTDQLILY